jgi:hypothetical protein
LIAGPPPFQIGAAQVTRREEEEKLMAGARSFVELCDLIDRDINRLSDLMIKVHDNQRCFADVEIGKLERVPVIRGKRDCFDAFVSSIGDGMYLLRENLKTISDNQSRIVDAVENNLKKEQIDG